MQDTTARQAVLMKYPVKWELFSQLLDKALALTALQGLIVKLELLLELLVQSGISVKGKHVIQRNFLVNLALSLQQLENQLVILVLLGSTARQVLKIVTLNVLCTLIAQKRLELLSSALQEVTTQTQAVFNFKVLTIVLNVLLESTVLMEESVKSALLGFYALEEVTPRHHLELMTMDKTVLLEGTAKKAPQR
jgi:hypothetical protein